MHPILLETTTIDLNSHLGFDSVWSALSRLVKNVFDWLYHIQINGIPLLYLYIGFSILITLFAVLLPVLRSDGSLELGRNFANDSAGQIDARVSRVIRRRHGGGLRSYRDKE